MYTPQCCCAGDESSLLSKSSLTSIQSTFPLSVVGCHCHQTPDKILMITCLVEFIIKFTHFGFRYASGPLQRYLPPTFSSKVCVINIQYTCFNHRYCVFKSIILADMIFVKSFKLNYENLPENKYLNI